MSKAEASPGELSAASADSSAIGRVRALAAIGIVLLTAALFWPTVASLMVSWQDTAMRTYTHGYLVVALSLWLLWRGRSRWADVSSGVSIPGFVLLIGLGFAWLVAYHAGLQFIHRALLPLIIASAVLTCFGPALAWRMGLPLAYLYFAVPVWDAINPLLQGISVFAVRTLLRLVGIPAYFEGNTFHIPAGAFEIADGCSGLHFFIVALSIAVLYGEFNRDSLRTRIKLVLFAGALAMLTNWLRILVIVIAGHLTDMQHYFVSKEHYTFGWWVFAGMMVAFFLVVQRWPVVGSKAPARPAGPPTSAIPPLGAGMALAGLLFAPLWNLLANGNPDPAALRPSHRQVTGWERGPLTDSDWQPVFKGADLQERSEYQADGVRIESFTALYALQEQGKELMDYENSPLGPTLRAQGHDLPAAAWNQVVVDDTRGARWLLWYIYRVGERQLTGSLRMQVEYGVRSLFGAPPSAIVAVRTRCEDDCRAAQARLSNFVAALSNRVP